MEVTKKLVRREAAMASEVEIQAACMLDPDFREAYEAFRAKREPRFR